MSISIDYISKEKFESQPKQIQEVLENHFEGAFGLYQDTDGTIKHGYWTKDRVRLLTLGQLQQFIEDNTYEKFSVVEPYWDVKTEGYIIKVSATDSICVKYITHKEDLLQAYYETVLQITKGGSN